MCFSHGVQAFLSVQASEKDAISCSLVQNFPIKVEMCCFPSDVPSLMMVAREVAICQILEDIIVPFSIFIHCKTVDGVSRWKQCSGWSILMSKLDNRASRPTKLK